MQDMTAILSVKTAIFCHFLCLAQLLFNKNCNLIFFSYEYNYYLLPRRQWRL